MNKAQKVFNDFLSLYSKWVRDAAKIRRDMGEANFKKYEQEVLLPLVQAKIESYPFITPRIWYLIEIFTEIEDEFGLLLMTTITKQDIEEYGKWCMGGCILTDKPKSEHI